MDQLQPINTVQLLNDAIVDARKWEVSLGRSRKHKAEKAFEALAKGRLELGHPQPHTYHITSKGYVMNQLALSKEISKSTKGKDGYSFYVIAVPLLLYPGRSAQYKLVESQFKIRSKNEQRQPAFYRIFPEPYWKPVLDWGGKLKLAVDGSLQWGAEVEQADVKFKYLGGQLAGRVKNLNELSGFARVLPFEYNMGRMEIEAQYSSDIAMWRLDSKEVIRGRKHIQFIFLVKVPNEVKQIHIEAAAQAEVAYDWLTAQVTHVLKYLSQSVQNALQQRKGLPLQDFKQWTITLSNDTLSR